MTKTKKKPAPRAKRPKLAAPIPPPVPCRVWYAWIEGWRSEHANLDLIAYLLVTEPGNLDAPIALVHSGRGGRTAQLKLAEQIIANPELAGRKRESEDEPYAEDLREIGRWWSTDATPRRLYDLYILAAEGTLATVMWQPVPFRPLCTVTLAQELEKYIRLREPQLDRAHYRHNCLGVSEQREDDGDSPTGDCVEWVVRRVEEYPYAMVHGVRQAYEAGRAAAANPATAPLKLVAPANRAMPNYKPKPFTFA